MSQRLANNKNALEQKLKDGKTAVPPWLERNAPTLPPPPAQSVGEGASRSRRTQPAYLGERLEAGDWRLAIFTSLQSLISRLQFRQQLRCGFGACLLVELSLPSTRWMSGAARTLHRRRCSYILVGGTVPRAVAICQSVARRMLLSSPCLALVSSTHISSLRQRGTSICMSFFALRGEK